MTAARKPATPPAFPYNVNVRLAAHHYAALLMIAEAEDCGLSAALRLVLDDLIEADIPQLKELAGLLASVTPDPAWLAKHGED